jgi:hypothetical protein
MVYTYAVGAAVLLIVYLWHVNRGMSGSPPDAAKLTSKRWTPDKVREAYEKTKVSPTDVSKHLPPRQGRRYIVIGVSDPGGRQAFYSQPHNYESERGIFSSSFQTYIRSPGFRALGRTLDARFSDSERHPPTPECSRLLLWLHLALSPCCMRYVFCANRENRAQVLLEDGLFNIFS